MLSRIDGWGEARMEYYSAGTKGFAAAYRVQFPSGLNFPSTRLVKRLANEFLGVKIGIFGVSTGLAILLLPARVRSNRKAAFLDALAKRLSPA